MLLGYWRGEGMLDANTAMHGKLRESSDAAVADRIARSLLYGRPFVVSALGSSVTAAHDNCNADGYPRQLEALLQPVFRAAGTSVHVRNAGVGGACGDTMRNQPWCVEQIAGSDVDVVHYSWSYFEAGNPDSPAQRETLVRWAQLLPHRPPVHVVSVSQASHFPHCNMSTGSPAMLEQYAAAGLAGFCLEQGLGAVGWGGREWGRVGDGIHNTTRTGEDVTDEDAKKAQGIVFRNWHPGPLGFQAVADVIGHNYVRCFLRALDMLEEAQKRSMLTEAFAPFPPLPHIRAPILCDRRVCDTGTLPHCITHNLPTYGSPRIALRESLWFQEDKHALATLTAGKEGGAVAPPFAPRMSECVSDRSFVDDTGAKCDGDVWMNPGHCQLHGGEEFEGKTAKASCCQCMRGDGKWNFWLDRPRAAFVPRIDRDRQECVHLDLCGAAESYGPEHGLLEYQIPPLKEGVVFACCCCGRNCLQHTLLKESVVWTINGKETAIPLVDGKPKQFPEDKCVAVQLALPPGEEGAAQAREGVVLGVRVKEHGSIIRISHVGAI
eukprot:TRINITY_DN3754_c0_g4_i2.p1 TRINITY_DN3754_c0_g4~~TRINITY_DN3754_c0_g4_i2.p1  ORF type:complete len:550 (+),score=154.26 TRINITY_DN3754_c0_g4_i2:325-1974(+)